MHSLMQVPVKSAVFGRFCFAHAYRDRSETYRQRNINSKHTVHTYVHSVMGHIRTVLFMLSDCLLKEIPTSIIFSKTLSIIFTIQFFILFSEILNIS